MTKCLFNKAGGLRPAALLNKDSSTGVVSRILRNSLEHLLCITYDYHVLYKIGIVKNLAKFTVKFLRTAASRINENKPCLASCKFMDILQN